MFHCHLDAEKSGHAQVVEQVASAEKSVWTTCSYGDDLHSHRYIDDQSNDFPDVCMRNLCLCDRLVYVLFSANECGCGDVVEESRSVETKLFSLHS